MTKPKHPKDLELEVLTKPQALWTKVVANLKAGVENSENELEINGEFLKVAEKKLKELSE